MTEGRKSGGFTLTELVMVIVLVGILAAYAAPRLGSISTYNLTRASNELIEAIRFAQASSMARADRDYQVVIGGGDKFRVREYLYATTTTQDTASPLSGTSPFVADSTEWSGITVTSLNLSFNTRGYPCATVAPCTSPMTTTQTVTVTLSGETRSLTIEPITGFVHAN